MDDQRPEEVEHIPWSQLLEEHRAARPWLVYLLAGVVAAAALGVLASRVLGRAPAPAVVVEAPVETTTTVGEAEQDGSPPVTPELYSEADLMAVYPDQAARKAAVRAEWFVTDYFTRDGDGRSDATSGTGAGAGPLSAVEWARALEVVDTGAGRFRVTVAFRSVTGDGSGWRRGPVRAVSVTMTGSESATIVDLPEPVSLAINQVADPPAAGGADPPAAVVAAALEQAADWGADPALVSAAPGEDGGWRVTVEVGDESGLRWLLAVPIGGGDTAAAD